MDLSKEKKTSFFRKLFFHDKWNVGIAKISAKDLIDGKKITDNDVTWLPEKPGFYFADSFLFKKDGKLWLFYENFNYKTNSAGLSAVEVLINDRGKIAYRESVDVLLENFHQSYPLIFEDNGIIYALPEHSESGNLTLYESVEFPHKWKKSKVLLEGFAGVDATPFKYNGLWWMFVSELGEHENNEVELYFAKELKGKWKKHPKSPVRRSARGTRMAGNVYEDKENGTLYRFGQNCTETYGGATVIFKIERLNETEYKETEVEQIKPFGKYSEGLHTISTLTDEPQIIALDAKRWADSPEVINKLLAILKKKLS